MTNEEIAKKIYNGNKELMPQLYENVKRLLRKLTFSYYSKHEEKCEKCGIELEDLIQECYLFLPKAVKAYNEKNSDLKFNTYISNLLKWKFNRLLYPSTARRTLDYCYSLDVPINDNIEDVTIQDTIKDDTNITEEEITKNITLKAVFPICKKVLTPLEYDVIYKKYKEEKQEKIIATECGIDINNVHIISRKAKEKLSHNTDIKNIYEAVIEKNYLRSGALHISSVEWSVLRIEEIKERMRGI